MVLRTAKCDSHPFLAYVGSVYAGFHGMMLKTLEKKKKRRPDKLFTRKIRATYYLREKLITIPSLEKL